MSKQVDLIGHEDTKVTIYHLHAPAILAMTRAQIASIHESEDIVVETFVAALESEVFLNLTSEEQAAWLRRVARNKIADYYRRIQRESNLSLDALADELRSEVRSPENEAIRQEEKALLQNAIRKLTPIQQTILRMRFVEGKTSVEIAAELGKREDAIRKILSRTLNRLRSIYTRF
jgi:RNA polymerase sigma factor (sigma-70 family)